MLLASPVTGPTLTPRTPLEGLARTPSTPFTTPPLLTLAPSTPAGGVVGVGVGPGGGVIGGLSGVLTIPPRSMVTSAFAAFTVNVYTRSSPFTSVAVSYPLGASTSMK